VLVEDLTHQVAELQKTVKSLHTIKGADKEIDQWFQNHDPVVGTTEKEAPWILVIHKKRTLLRPPPSTL